MARLRPDFTFSEGHLLALQKFAYDEMIRLSKIVDKKLHPQAIHDEMQKLTQKAQQAVNSPQTLEKTKQLLHFFYQQEGFKCSQSSITDCDHLNLSKVLQSRQGAPAAFSAILLQLSYSLKLPIYAVTFPTQLILRVEIPLDSKNSQSYFIDIKSGLFVTFEELGKWLEGHLGYAKEVTEQMVAVSHMPELIDEIETEFKLALTKEMRFEEALDVIAYRLDEQPDEPYNIRDRGLIYAALGLHKAAIKDLQHFITECPNDPSLLAIAAELHRLKNNPNMHLH